MESLRDVKRRMAIEVDKGRATPLEIKAIGMKNDECFKEITSMEHFKQVLNWLLRLNEYRTGEATVVNNVYMNIRPMAKQPEFFRAKSVIERMNYSLNAINYVKRKMPSFEGDCILEEAVCQFYLPDEIKQQCKFTYDGKETYAFSMSNRYILGLFCHCEDHRAGFAKAYKVNHEIVSQDDKLKALENVKDVLFQALLLDDVWEDGDKICAKLYTIYVIDKEA